MESVFFPNPNMFREVGDDSVTKAAELTFPAGETKALAEAIMATTTVVAWMNFMMTGEVCSMLNAALGICESKAW
jgi:hypothetical protein